MGAELMRYRDRQQDAESVQGGPEETRVLLVGHFGGAVSDEIRSRFSADMRVIDFSALTGPLLEDFAPHFVVSPVVTRGFDIMDLAHRLWQLGYSGSYRALTDIELPNPALIVREVRLACPGLDVDVLSVDLRRGPPI